MSTNGHHGPQVLIFSPAVYTACVVLSVDSTRRGSHAAGGDVLQSMRNPTLKGGSGNEGTGREERRGVRGAGREG